jgi:hypothetical protein
MWTLWQVAAFVAGWAMQDMVWTLYVFLGALGIAIVVRVHLVPAQCVPRSLKRRASQAVVPPWPLYARTPLAFQPPVPAVKVPVGPAAAAAAAAAKKTS